MGGVICTKFVVLFSDWTGKDKDEQDISVWEDNWEDDNVEDDFNKQLRFVGLFTKLSFFLNHCLQGPTRKTESQSC